MGRLFESDIFLKLLSVVLAVALWYGAMGEQNPEGEYTVKDVEVQVAGLPEGMCLVQGSSPAMVNVKIRAKHSVASALGPKDFKATVDLGQANVGANVVDIAVQVPEGVGFVAATPARARVVVEPAARARVPVSVRLAGTAAPGYVCGQPAVRPTDVDVDGPASAVTLVAGAVAEVDVGQASEMVVRAVPVKAVAADGSEIRGVSVRPAFVEVWVPVAEAPFTKVVPVAARLTGKPAPGFCVAGVEVEPQEVQLSGLTEALAGVHLAATAPVDIEGASADVMAEADLVLPPHALPATGPKVAVRVVIERARRRTFEGVAVVAEGLREGLSAQVLPEAVVVTVEGAEGALGNLAPSLVRATVEARGLPPGMHVLRVSVDVPGWVRVVMVEPEGVRVRVTERE